MEMRYKHVISSTIDGKNNDGSTWVYIGDHYYSDGMSKLIFHGRGKYTWGDGRVYEGDWVEGKIHGKGKFTYSNGNVYEGDWLDGKYHGKGKYTWASGDVYEGDWVDDKFHGKGKYTWADGRVYEGDWVDDKQHGKGKFTHANGRVFEGDWVDGKQAEKQTGKGKKKSADGSAGEKKGGDTMGFIYCPNCGQSVSNQAKISACPKCYHPFNAKEWQKIQAQKDALAAEEKRKRDALVAEANRKKAEEEQRLYYAKGHDECPLCHKPISWEEKRYSESGYNYQIYSTFRHPYCKSCGWNSSLAFEEGGNDWKNYTAITDWKRAVEKCQKNNPKGY